MSETSDQNQTAEVDAREILAELVMLDDRRRLTTLPHPDKDRRVDKDDIHHLVSLLDRAMGLLMRAACLKDGGPHGTHD